MHTIAVILEYIVIIIMDIVMRINGEKTNYLKAPDHIISEYKRGYIAKLGHLLPSLVLSILLVVKVLPWLSAFYAVELDKNSHIITITVIQAFIFVLIINGMLIEGILNAVNPGYFEFKNRLHEDE